MADKTRARSIAPEDAGDFGVPVATDKDELIVEGLRQNNLKDLYLSIPHNKITAIVGPSGSGKSSLAFDTLFAEGRWRFIESLSTYTRLFLERMDRPELDSIRNIRPAIAVEQKNPVRTSRSTVGTATELNDYMRVFFARVGSLHCTGCGSPVRAVEPGTAAEDIIQKHSGSRVIVGFTMPLSGKTMGEAVSDLIQKGFVRIRAGEETVDITEVDPSVLSVPKSEALGVVADRLVARKKELARLTESLESAYREGGGQAWAETTGTDGEKTLLQFSRRLKCDGCGTTAEKPDPISLSFNHPVGACPECKGFGNVLKYDIGKVIPDEGLSLGEGAVEPWTKPAYRWWHDELKRHAGRYGIGMDKPFGKLSARERRLVFEGTADFDGLDGFFEYLESKKYKLHVKVFSSRYKGQFTCESCKGSRLKKQALSVTVEGMNIAEVNALSIEKALKFFKNLKLTPFEKKVSREVFKQITAKLSFLNQTGLGYITLDRPTKTLSGGEAQRVSIATQLAANLTGVLYILDEPSVGLHPVDIDTLAGQLRELSKRGNTVVVVEHDPSIISSSDHITELGPGAGERGGRLVYSGPTEEFLKDGRTLTSGYLTGRLKIHTPRWRRKGNGNFIELKGASGNNLKSVDVRLPLKTLTCVTGVSGSGKSTLVVDTLYNIIASHHEGKGRKGGGGAVRPLPYKSIYGLGNITGVKLVDQGPIGRTPRSNPITYIGGFDEIRRLYAGLPAAYSAGLTPGHFSFNIPGGRCEACRGEGVEKLEMYFLPDVYIRCAACGGKRYKGQVLEARLAGRSIYDCLEMTFNEAAALFANERALTQRLEIVQEVGLGYLKLGQSATTLSGGEAQRLKVARELMEKDTGDTLYIFDEPTTGLHMDDTKRLLSVLGRLVDSGNTVLIIEHNLDCIKTADHIIDLGPGGGEQGGNVVASGTPEAVARVKKSVTGRYLKVVLA